MIDSSLSLVVRRVIAASPERLFEAWTSPAQLRAWWGPKGVRCIAAEVDLRVGGKYRIGNELPDQSVVWISGEFELISPPDKLVYSWSIAPEAVKERVSVSFQRTDQGTEVVIVHERISNQDARTQHALGWEGCLDGLSAYSKP